MVYGGIPDNCRGTTALERMGWQKQQQQQHNCWTCKLYNCIFWRFSRDFNHNRLKKSILKFCCGYIFFGWSCQHVQKIILTKYYIKKSIQNLICIKQPLFVSFRMTFIPGNYISLLGKNRNYGNVSQNII